MAGAVKLGPRLRGDELQTIPGIGPAMAEDLRSLGIKKVADLKKADPQRLYDRLCEKTGAKQDRCVLYVFRCAVYYASRPVHEPEKLKWWNWKDGR
jgi:RecG-like helicase